MSWSVFVKSSEGETFSLNVDPEDTVLTVKSKLKLQQDIPVESQQLIYGYLQFRETDSLSNYKLQEPQSLMMTCILNDGSSLYVNCLCGFHSFKQLTILRVELICSLVHLAVTPSDTIETLKSQTISKHNKDVNADDIDSFHFAGQMPNEETLSECNVMDQSTIHLILLQDDQRRDTIESVGSIVSRRVTVRWIYPQIKRDFKMYQAMLENIKWRHIPRVWDEEMINPYFHLLIAIEKQTENTPSRIKNKIQFINALQNCKEFTPIRGCKEDADNFYDAFKELFIDENIGEVVQSAGATKETKKIKSYHSISGSAGKELQMTLLKANNGNEALNEPLLHRSSVTNQDDGCCRCIVQ